MKANSPSQPANTSSHRSSPLLLAAAFFMLGAVVGGIWVRHHQSAGAANGATNLSTPVKNLLGQLPVPVSVHYYALLPNGSADASLETFASQVSGLLDSMQGASDGKLNLTTITTSADTNAAAAGADGLQAFNLDKGSGCFLGIALINGTNKETFARLQPEWEPALQYDLARAIARVAAIAPPAKPAPEIAKPSSEIVSNIKRLIPDVSGTSVDTADQIFHADFMQQYAAASEETEAQVTAAQQQAIQAQKDGSPADIAAAQNHLAQVQTAQADKIKQLAANLKIELAVFEQLKASATNSEK